MTVKGFKKSCIFIGMDGTDDDMLWNGSEEDGNVRSECAEDKGTDCENGDSDNWYRLTESDMIYTLTLWRLTTYT